MASRCGAPSTGRRSSRRYTSCRLLRLRPRLVLGQVAVDEKSNEITALPALLNMLSLKGRIVTADAMHTQRTTAETVTQAGGDYVLALKRNQETLHEDVALWLDDPGNVETCENLSEC